MESGSVYDSQPQTTRRPPTLVAIQPGSSISWAPELTKNTAAADAAAVVGGKNVNHSPTIVVLQHVSVVPAVGSESVLQDIASNSNLVTLSTSNSDLDQALSEPVNYREDIKLDDHALVAICTKELYRLFEKESISKARRKQIKSERRTLKHRIALNYQVDTEEDEKGLERKILELNIRIEKIPPVSTFYTCVFNNI